MDWTSVKLPDNFQIREHSRPCLFHIKEFYIFDLMHKITKLMKGIIFYLFQTDLLQDHMRQLRRVIRPGSKLLNWSSLGISDFVQKSGAVSRREITLLEVELFT